MSTLQILKFYLLAFPLLRRLVLTRSFKYIKTMDGLTVPNITLPLFRYFGTSFAFIADELGRAEKGESR